MRSRLLPTSVYCFYRWALSGIRHSRNSQRKSKLLMISDLGISLPTRKMREVGVRPGTLLLLVYVSPFSPVHAQPSVQGTPLPQFPVPSSSPYTFFPISLSPVALSLGSDRHRRLLANKFSVHNARSVQCVAPRRIPSRLFVPISKELFCF